MPANTIDTTFSNPEEIDKVFVLETKSIQDNFEQLAKGKVNKELWVLVALNKLDAATRLLNYCTASQSSQVSQNDSENMQLLLRTISKLKGTLQSVEANYLCFFEGKVKENNVGWQTFIQKAQDFFQVFTSFQMRFEIIKNCSRRLNQQEKHPFFSQHADLIKNYLTKVFDLLHETQTFLLHQMPINNNQAKQYAIGECKLV